MKENSSVPELYQEISRLGARDMESCMQCGNCSASCPLSKEDNTFPRKIYRYLQTGLRKKLLESPEPWLCYYCGECNEQCPRGAEPAETMMATRRWLTTQYDWTGLAAKFYVSPKWEIGAFLAIFFFVVALFGLFHGPIVTDRVELNTFAPAHWVHIGDEIMVVIVMGLLLSNGFNMYRKIMGNTRIPFILYVKEAHIFFYNYFTQKKWRRCGTGPGSAWWRHLFLFSGWVAMEVLVMVFLTSFQTDIVHPFWHPTRIIGYYATVALLLASGSMLYSRWFVKQSNYHRYSDFTDIFFLCLIFLIALTGILVHFARLAQLPLTTYSLYVFHVAVCVAMLMIMIPFGKLSHLLYRPLAIFLTTVKQKAKQTSSATPEKLANLIGEAFKSCMQCGACTASCPMTQLASFSPRQILRNITVGRPTTVGVDEASWHCVTCNSCVEACPRGIPLSDMIRAVRTEAVGAKLVPTPIQTSMKNLKKHANPLGVRRGERQKKHHSLGLSSFSREMEYCLFMCCTTVFAEKSSATANSAKAITSLLSQSGLSFGSLGSQERCCGDLAKNSGYGKEYNEIQRDNHGIFRAAGVKKLITTSPHCLTAFLENKQDYTSLLEPIHYTQLFADLIQQAKLIPRKEVALRVTYHDPCYLGRQNKIYDAPRNILDSIPGLTFIEMHNSKARANCCGGGGGSIFNNEGYSIQASINRVREAIATGADVLVTSCPYCLNMFTTAIEKDNLHNRIQVMDISDILLLSVKPVKIQQNNAHENPSINQEEMHV